MKIEREIKTTVIETNLFSFNKVRCVIEKNEGGDSSAKFTLKIEKGGQVYEGCDLVMSGSEERRDLLAFLKQLVFEIELLDNKK